ncbi:agmatine deiminase family protein [Thiohalobacter sp. IOR34]|uniref:agmatine deiminase family protein n=1 Tax=Thiohalobacter sp. IOR34 TaxID=3057176 RepID=UPI0025AF74F4|nr:agmatine deiminase family protein [Thiohalobacter sp. IOR34]WJW76771.1 agmatine deiminase family protein [Thiohalobacter sp. IOR34]
MTRRLPAEWSPQDGVLLTWPHPHSDWAPRLAEVEAIYLALARAIAAHETLVVCCYDEAHRAHVADHLLEADVDLRRVRLHCVASDDTWVRDYGPLCVLEDGRPRLLDFIFNGWGGKYPSELDTLVTAGLHAAGAFGETPREAQPLVLEGGAIDTDGEGSLLTTERCLLDPHRNPDLDRAGLERELRSRLGVERILWLRHGWLEGDDTDGHVDMLARFCALDCIAHAICEDPDDPHYEPLQAMAGELAALRRSDGSGYRLVPLPLPAPVHDSDGRRLPASYANFLIINDAVLVPAYGDANDAVAVERLAEVFPGREIHAIDSRPLIVQAGGLHCASMQLPQGVLGEEAA